GRPRPTRDAQPYAGIRAKGRESLVSDAREVVVIRSAGEPEQPPEGIVGLLPVNTRADQSSGFPERSRPVAQRVGAFSFAREGRPHDEGCAGIRAVSSDGRADFLIATSAEHDRAPRGTHYCVRTCKSFALAVPRPRICGAHDAAPDASAVDARRSAPIVPER